MQAGTRETGNGPNEKSVRNDWGSGLGSNALLTRRLQRLCWLLVALLIAGAVQLELLVVLFPQRALTIDSGEVKADVIVVLGGGLYARPERAAELFKEGAGSKIVVSGTNDSQENVQTLVKNGVPATAIVVEGASNSTLENAKFSAPLLRQMGARRVIIVTSWFHSRRARACFEHFAPEIEFYSRPTYWGYPSQEWDSKGITRQMRLEYVKLPLYWLCYGVCPL